MASTGRHLRIEPFGDNVLGVRLLGDRRRPEPDEFRVAFPGGDITVARCSDGAAYWIHVRVDHAADISHPPIDGKPEARIVSARLDVHGKHSADVDVGGFADPNLYHLAVKVAPAVEAAEAQTALPLGELAAPARKGRAE